MFTTIKWLRNSNAMQARVTSVARNLKGLNPNWKDTWLFPILAVGLSNSLDDVHWVFINREVVLQPMNMSVRMGSGSSNINVRSLIRVAETNMDLEVPSHRKTAYIAEQLKKFEEAMATNLGLPEYSWFLSPFDLPSESALNISSEETKVEEKQETPKMSLTDRDILRAIGNAMKVFETANPSFNFERTKHGTYANERVNGKFKAFFQALQLAYKDPEILAKLYD